LLSITNKKILSSVTYDHKPRFELLSGVDEPRELQYEEASEHEGTPQTHADETPIATWNPEGARTVTHASTTTETAPSVVIEEILRLIKPPSMLSPLSKTPTKQKRRASYNFHGLVTSARRQEKLAYQCRQCDREFTSRVGLQNHSRVHNVRGKRYECQICQTMFTTKKALNVHMKTHRIESAYRCITCEKAFMTVSSLTRHLLNHPQIRAIVCPICGLSFVAEECLIQHIATVHPAECVVDELHKYN
jgi:DNA-directed RNA polymerase subunit RPC12/RpoP